jgi:hypothetical protein
MAGGHIALALDGLERAAVAWHHAELDLEYAEAHDLDSAAQWDAYVESEDHLRLAVARIERERERERAEAARTSNEAD